MPDQCKVEDLLILGTGPAGLTAAIYAARANLDPLVLHGQQPGGQLTTTTLVENYPGFPDGIDGPELMQRLEQQARRFGTRLVQQTVQRVDLTPPILRVFTEEGCYQGRTLIITTGASAKMLGLPGEKEMYGRGVSVCATCDGFFYRDKEVVVVGGGDTAMEDATFLARFARHVTVVHRRDQLRATPPLQQRARNHPRISFRWDTVVSALHGDRDSGLTGLTLRHVRTGEEELFSCDGVFIAVGHQPNTELFRNQLRLDQGGYIVTRNGAETNIPGVFAAGDVQDDRFRQAITAAGTGAMAAIQAERFLDSVDAHHG